MQLTTKATRSSFVFLPQQVVPECRCGVPSLDEACVVCEQLICEECAVFVQPGTRVPARPSDLMAERVSRDFLAHRGCLSNPGIKTAASVYSKDVRLMVQILKGNQPFGRALRAR